MASAELLLHPVRLRIIQALLGGRELTTAQLGDLLSDVSTATLYRQVATLADAGLLTVAQERRVRGSVERTYRLDTAAASTGPDEARAMNVEQHRQAFTAFVAGLLADFDRYLARDHVDLGADLVGYRQAVLNLTDAEAAAFLAEYRALLTRWLALQPEPGRARRLFATFTMPGT